MYNKYNYMYMCWEYMRKNTINFYFSETLTNTCEQKIKNSTIERKNLNKLILYKWSIVQLVIYHINEKINIPMN